jgi:hypothetical protein
VLPRKGELRFEAVETDDQPWPRGGAAEHVRQVAALAATYLQDGSARRFGEAGQELALGPGKVRVGGLPEKMTDVGLGKEALLLGEKESLIDAPELGVDFTRCSIELEPADREPGHPKQEQAVTKTTDLGLAVRPVSIADR